MIDKSNERRAYIGSGDVAGILAMYHPEMEGLTKYTTCADTWLRIVHAVKQPANAKMDRGLRVEPELRALYRESVGPCSEPPGVIVHPRAEWACGSPDGLIGDVGIFEAKTTVVWARHLWGDGGDLVPNGYNLQCQWLMECAGREWTHLLCAFGEDSKTDESFSIKETVVYEMERDAELCAELFRCAEDFWRTCVVARRPPGIEPRHNKATFKRLKDERHGDEFLKRYTETGSGAGEGPGGDGRSE